MKEDRVLSLRMQQVADLVTPCATVADVGCDHGYVSIYLLQQAVVEHVIAMDIRKGPLSRAIQNRDSAGLQTRMDCRLSDGLDKLEAGEAETIVIAGMGGPLMIDILERGRRRGVLTQHLVLQPQSDIPAVRRYLHSIGYERRQEAFLKEDGKYYTVMQADGTANSGVELELQEIDSAALADGTANSGVESKLQEVDARYGLYLLEQKQMVLWDYLQKEEAQLSHLRQALIIQMEKTVTSRVKGRLDELERELELNQEAQSYYKV
jgi:tRNA (adenine22-N1)-methyltransferase